MSCSGPRTILINTLQRKFIQWEIPLAERALHFERRICERWQRRALEELGPFDLSSKRLPILADDFWTANSHESTMPRSTFVDQLRIALRASQLGSPVCAVLSDLLNILIQHFSLTAEIQTNLVLYSPQLLEWCSDTKENSLFGSSGNFEKFSLTGKNSLFVVNEHEGLSTKLPKIETSLTSDLPTRCFIIGPSSLFSNLLRRRDVLELARVPINFPFLTTQNLATCIIHAKHSISLILALNRESCQIDPIDWKAFKNEMLDWTTKKSLSLEFIDDTDRKFRERKSSCS